ncbi:MAG: nucleotidyltransferase family protein, partial [Nodosilinea sp.]
QRAARFNLTLVRELKTILAALNRATIPVIVLKGAYLAQAIYPQLHLRQMGDMDLLVPQERVVEAYALVQSLGYQVYRQHLDDVSDTPAVMVGENSRHHLTPLGKAPGLPLVELHWTLCDADEAADFSLAELWQRAQPITLAGEPALARLSAADGEALVARAVDQAVVGLVYQNLQALPQGTVPEAMLTPLRAASQRAARFNLTLVRELKTILAALNRATIPVIVLKGAYLAQAIYPQLHLR